MSGRGSARSLLALADDVLVERGHVPASARTRAAAHLARQALEFLVVELLTEREAALPEATMRSRLIVLAAVDGPSDTVRDARAAWEGLSGLCHRHAFELFPGEAEVRSQIGVVRRLASNTEPPTR